MYVDVTFLAADSGVDAVVRDLMPRDRVTLQAERISRAAQEPRVWRAVRCVADGAAFALERHLVGRYVFEAIQLGVLGVTNRALGIASLRCPCTGGFDRLHVACRAIEPAVLDRMVRNVPHFRCDIAVTGAAQWRRLVAQQRSQVTGSMHRMAFDAAQASARVLMLQAIGLERQRVTSQAGAIRCGCRQRCELRHRGRGWIFGMRRARTVTAFALDARRVVLALDQQPVNWKRVRLLVVARDAGLVARTSGRRWRRRISNRRGR